MSQDILDDLELRMDSSLESLKKDFAGLRTGRASVSMIEPVMVEVYGSMMPINQVGTLGVPEPRLITVQVWDKSNAPFVDKAIRQANLGLNPQVDGNTIRIPIPPLTEERRIEMVKIAAKYAEQSRVAVRNVRRDGMEAMKKAEKDGEISEDELKTWQGKIQALTDDHIKAIDEMLAHREKEIKQV